ncbi:ABC transporter ATP-binding protein [Bifidobacterium sp. 82T10]|uniref:ABC transporter ATP-binding protein n=1 Tax=Bifidobacterium miconis TaxID=2834435 RepID=A0ABS6WDH5_9BIFI|nr:ABC transporter ATP-binding protein [Bifidobacterium miconis]MBW3092100.1 ABC transporter ATP-binding protein [Bifidobacterium miconis]
MSAGLPHRVRLGLRVALFTLLMVVGGFDGVVLAQAISTLPRFVAGSSVQSMIAFGVGYLLAFCAIWSCEQLAVMVENVIVRDLLIDRKRRYIEAKLRYVSSDKASQVVSKINNDFALYRDNYLKAVFTVAVDLTMGTVSMVYMLWLNAPLAVLFILFSLLPMAAPKLFASALRRSSEAWSVDTERFNQSLSDAFDARHGLYTNGAFATVLAYMERRLRRSESSMCTMSNRQGLAGVAMVVLSALAYLVPITIGLLMMHAGWPITGASLVAMFMASDRVSGPFRAAAEHCNEIATTKTIRGQIRRALHGEMPTAPEVTRMELHANDTDGWSAIAFDVPAVRHADATLLPAQRIDVRAGEKIALVGPSGIGKSSLLDTIQGYVDGRDISVGDDLSRHVGFIEQRPFVFDDDVRFNLTFGEPFDDARLLDVLGKVGLAGELGDDPLSYACGEHGSKLSGGQVQRIEIARTLLRGKRILLADEPTSSLDPDNAERIVSLLLSLPVTLIMATHDTQYTRDFDRVLEITPDHRLIAKH